MKSTILTSFGLLFLGLLLSCQNGGQDNTSVNPILATRNRNAQARVSCSGKISYRFIYPTTDYFDNSNGCRSFYVYKGFDRQVSIEMINTSGSTQTTRILVTHGTDTSYFQYSIASKTGGSIFPLGSGPASGGGFYWTVLNMPSNTTYTLVLNIEGALNSSSAENSVALSPVLPCQNGSSLDCGTDDYLHLILQD